MSLHSDASPRKSVTIRPGQVWQDDFEPARILAVAEGYAMMRRHGSNPFLLPLGALKAGAHGWRKLSDDPQPEAANG